MAVTETGTPELKQSPGPMGEGGGRGGEWGGGGYWQVGPIMAY